MFTLQRSTEGELETKNRLEECTTNATRANPKILIAFALRVELIGKELKFSLPKLNIRMNHISRATSVLKGPDCQSYSKMTYKASVIPKLISKKFKIFNIPKYYGTIDLYEHILYFTIAIKGNDLTK